MNSDSDKVQAALTRLIEGEGEPEDDNLVAKLLRESPGLRQQLRQQLLMDALLRLEAEPSSAGFVEEVAARIQAPVDDSIFLQRVESALPGRRGGGMRISSLWAYWLQWRSLAAGLLLGVFCTSAVWAVTAPYLRSITRISLPVTNANFEDELAPAPLGIPTDYGKWSGDYAEIVGAGAGVIPKEGVRMLRFRRSSNALVSTADRNLNGNLYQVVDLRSYRKAISDGQAKLDWSAWFYWAPGTNEKGMSFALNLWSFTGSTTNLPLNWSDHLYQETAKSGKRLAFDEFPRTWTPLAGSMIIPPDTDFLVVELKVMPSESPSNLEAYEFSECFADQVKLVLNATANAGGAVPLHP